MVKIFFLVTLFLRCQVILYKKLYNFLFSPKKLVLISNNSIKNYHIGSHLQVAAFLVLILILFLFTKSWHHSNVVAMKNGKISNLTKINSDFESQIDSLNSYLVKVDGYFNLVSEYDHIKDKDSVPKISSLTIDRFKDVFDYINLDDNGRQIVDKFVKAKILQDNVSRSIQSRISGLEKTLLFTGIDFPDGHIEKDENNVDNSDVVLLNAGDNVFAGQGGPVEDDNFKLSNNGNIGSIKIDNRVKYLNNLETILNYLPISKPMKNYYISSNFGNRIDPITQNRTMHSGTDFVGSSLNEDILSPSPGKVVFAGKFYDYGNMVVIDHGFDIKTRYAHLSKIKVKKGDFVEKNEVIGLQGNTGRSTGAHLHYEIRYKNRPIDPKKFLKVGQEVF